MLKSVVFATSTGTFVPSGWPHLRRLWALAGRNGLLGVASEVSSCFCWGHRPSVSTPAPCFFLSPRLDGAVTPHLP